MARRLVPRACDHLAACRDPSAAVDVEVTRDVPWRVQRVENGRFELSDGSAAADAPVTATLWVAPTRDRGEVTHASGEVWQVTRPDRTFRFAAASGGLLAVADKPSVIRERFELESSAFAWQLTVEPVRPWRRRWRVEDPDGTVGTVERRGYARQVHELRLPGGLAGSHELAVVIGWLVAAVCTDPPRGWRATSGQRRRR